MFCVLAILYCVTVIHTYMCIQLEMQCHHYRCVHVCALTTTASSLALWHYGQDRGGKPLRPGLKSGGVTSLSLCYKDTSYLIEYAKQCESIMKQSVQVSFIPQKVTLIVI